MMNKSLCLNCNDSISCDERRFGYPDCYDKHTFCKECIRKLIKNNRKCPIDERSNKVIVFEEGNVRYELFKFDEGLMVERIDGKLTQRNSNDLPVVEYCSNICLSCLNEVSDDANMFWGINCPKSHRMCFDCTFKDGDYFRGCLIRDYRCLRKDTNTDDYDRCSLDDQGKFDRLIYYTSKSTDVGPIIEVPLRYIESLQYLKSRIDELDSPTSEDVGDNCHGSTEYSIERVKYVYETAKSDCTFPRDICMICLQNIEGKRYGLSKCYEMHSFCECCSVKMSKTSDRCPIDGTEFHTLNVTEDETYICDIDVYYLQIRESLKNLGVRNEESEALLTTMLKSPNCEASIPPTLCLRCFTDLEDVIYELGGGDCRGHTYCEGCAIEILTHGKHGLMGSALYLSMDIHSWKTAKCFYIHYLEIIEYARVNNIVLKSNWWNDFFKYPKQCLKCDNRVVEARYNRNSSCGCYRLCCKGCRPRSCPFLT